VRAEVRVALWRHEERQHAEHGRTRPAPPAPESDVGSAIPDGSP
jgi:hypothetical protein